MNLALTATSYLLLSLALLRLWTVLISPILQLVPTDRDGVSEFRPSRRR